MGTFAARGGADTDDVDTLFGAEWGPVRRTGSVLRAAAGRIGVQVTEVSETELAAAVLGAQALTAITGVPPSRVGVRYGRGVAAAAAAVLARAAGCGEELAPWDGPHQPHPPAAVQAVIAAMEPARAWASEQLGDEAARAWQLCASDLTAGVDSEAAAVLEWVAAWCADQALH